MSGNGATSLRKIAEASGVSVSTVSRVLLQRSNVNAKTRQRVVDVARQLKYRPNLLVRGIQTGETRTVGVMLRIQDPFYARIYAGIHDTLLTVDHVPILVWSGQGEREGTDVSELDQIHRLVDRRVDGVILMPVEDAASDEYLHEIWDRQIPLVAVDRELPQSHADFVGSDDRQIGRIAAEHLLGLGHRRLGHLAGPLFASTGRYRREGFAQAVRETPGATLLVVEEPSFRDGRDKALGMLQRDDRPTAVFAANDHLAVGVYDAAAQLGLRIPEDVSVIGSGNLTCGQSLRPTMSTVDQHGYEIGRRAASLLLDRKADTDDAAGPKCVRLAPSLVARSSTATVPAR